MVSKKVNDRTLKIGTGLAVFFLIGVLLFVAVSFMTGYGFRLLNFAKSLPGVVRALQNNQTVTSLNGDYRNIVFLHHSVGEGLVRQGKVRELFTQAGYNFWDQGYNQDGLNDPAGRNLEYSYAVPNDNTDPDGLAMVFSQPAYSVPINTLSQLLQYEVIIVKSCFPANNITSEQELDQYKNYYLTTRKSIDQHPDKLFVLLTIPPLNPAETKPEIAVHAREFANWLKSDEFLKGHPNVVTFDLFEQFAEGNPQAPDFNMLRRDYRDGADSHPNRLGNETVGPLFADFIIQAAEQYRATSAR
jgi:hypothetical protein